MIRICQTTKKPISINFRILVTKLTKVTLSQDRFPLSANHLNSKHLMNRRDISFGFFFVSQHLHSITYSLYFLYFCKYNVCVFITQKSKNCEKSLQLFFTSFRTVDSRECVFINCFSFVQLYLF